TYSTTECGRSKSNCSKASTQCQTACRKDFSHACGGEGQRRRGADGSCCNGSSRCGCRHTSCCYGSSSCRHDCRQTTMAITMIMASAPHPLSCCGGGGGCTVR